MSGITKEHFDETIDELARSTQQGFASVHAEVQKLDGKLTTIGNKLDRALYHDLDLHERWIKQLADKAGVKLVHE